MRESGRNSHGFALVEVAVSLLLVSVATLGLAGMQLSARRATFEAVQRSHAAAYAMAMMESMRANASALPDYALADDQYLTVAEPPGQCSTSACNPAQLARFQLWYWLQALAGRHELKDGLPVGGLVNARPCIQVSGSWVEVAIAWDGRAAMPQTPDSVDCGAGLGDTRQLLVLSGFIGERNDDQG